MRKRLIINADDYGRSPGVSRGILQAHREGIVTSTTVMVNQPDVETQLAEALACPKLGIGLHLVFSAWRPTLPPEEIPSLVDSNGFFLSQHDLWAHAEEISIAQLRAEFRTQMKRFGRLTGRLPDHVDCHHFVHLYPPFFQVYADLAAEFDLPLRVPFPPEADFRRAIATLPYLEEFPIDLVRGMVVTNSALLKARQLCYPDHFISTFFGMEVLTLDFVLDLLRTLPQGTSELMCHPGHDDAGLAGSTYRSEREIELQLLTDPSVRACLVELGIDPVTFDVLHPSLSYSPT
jgi:predicted glycoside hydrolase/deacetylase ChbG (UPF0249 family)